MIKNLLYHSNFTIGKTRVKRGLMTLVLLLMGPASTLLLAQESKDQLFGPTELSLTYDFNACSSYTIGNSAYEYDEFTSEEGVSCANVNSGALYRHAGKHSCTDDAQGNPGDAACFQSSKDITYSPDHELAIRFDVTLEGLSNRSSRLNGISFQQLAPQYYLWSAEGFDSDSGPNNYPTKYGIRVLKDGVEIYLENDLNTTQYWNTETFSFQTNENFQVRAGQTSIFTFELTSYAPVGNGATVSAWDLDDLKIYTACEIECNLSVDAGEDQNSCENEAVVLTANALGGDDCEDIISSYKITDSSTEGKCFPTWGTGVIFQKGGTCEGLHHIWSAGNDLMLQEFSDETAKITGSVIDQNGVVGIVDILLYDKEGYGTSWQEQCYQDGLATDPRTFYQSFEGTITINGQQLTVALKSTEQHYLLSDGAGFEAGQYGLGAWTGGTFGECTEWFGTLEPMQTGTGDNNLTYLWSTGETTPSITVTESGEYTVTVKDCKGCTATDSVNVTIDQATADAGEDVTLCKGDSTTLSVSGEGTYLWSTGETSDTIEVSPEATTTYSVTVTNGTCEATDEVVVTIDQATAEAGEDVTLCKGDSTTLSVSGEGTYLWSTGETSNTIEVSPEVTTTYSVTVTNGTCEATDEVVVTIDQATAEAGEDVTLCKGDSTTLSVSGEGTYLWSTGETSDTIEVSPEVTTTYSVTVTNGTCEATDEVVVTIDQATAEAGEDVTLCKGDSTTLSVSGEGTYLWSTGETSDTIEVSPEVTTTYSVTVTNGTCEATDEVVVTIDQATAEASEDVTLCKGDSTTLSVSGEGTYLWSTGETSNTIEVSPEVTTTYSVTVTNGTCEATDEVVVTIEDKIIIGDYVWLDKNRNGIQDDGATGINNITVELYQCNGNLVDMCTTADNGDGEAGYYQFEVCPNSGEYYVVFGGVPESLEFTDMNAGTSTTDSNANDNGQTLCFSVEEENNLTIDTGLKEVCDITVDLGKEQIICTNSTRPVELTATVKDESGTCEGGCVYPILEQERCFGPTGTFEIWLNSNARSSSWKFKASEQRFERLANGDARYTAKATNGVDNIDVDVTFSGYTTTPTLGSPKLNDCQDYDTSEWEYWTEWNGTITSENHGVFTLSMMGAPFQMGIGADVVRSGFGASGWFTAEGGDGYYTIGDINIPLEECQENGVEYKWTTQDGNIISDPYKKTISVDQPGTYVFEAMNCIDCYTSDKITLTEVSCGKSTVDNSKKISTVYPVPVVSGGTLTIEFGTKGAAASSKSAVGPQLEEDVTMVVYDMNGRLISVPRSFKMVNGKAIIYLDIDSIPSGKYIVRAQGKNWAESKHILVK